jgi:acetyl esterase/lipase
MHLLARTKVKSAILGAGAPIRFLGVKANPNAPREDRFRDMTVDEARATANVDKVTTPILILVGTADSLLPINRLLHDRLEKAGKPVRMEIYENGYHDFVMGPQGQNRPDLQGGERLMDITMMALESALTFTKRP